MNNWDRNLIIANIGMNERQVKFIDEIAREMRFSGGKKPSRSRILSTFIKIIMSMKVDVSRVKSEKDVEERFFQAFRTKLDLLSLDIHGGVGLLRGGTKNVRNSISKSV